MSWVNSYSQQQCLEKCLLEKIALGFYLLHTTWWGLLTSCLPVVASAGILLPAPELVLPVLPPAGISKSTAARPVGRESQARAGRFVESWGWQSQPAPWKTVSLWPLLVSLWIPPLPGTHENYSLMSKCQTCCRVQSLYLQGCSKINSVLPWLLCSILALTLPPVRMP